ncbi:hypothetical protein ABT095_32665 [Kitasatospora sp. NPDC002227]|uniref:hypothetical protein n=1 Tax=Kitasatospora sp. NPDC002227 TaxID=3154773 RepID=UPI003319EB1B
MADAPHLREPDGEDEVRAMLQRYVSAVEPAPDALRHIRTQVPRRRARRRQVGTGLVAGFLLLTVAAPRFTDLGLRPPGEPNPIATFAQSGDSESPSPRPSASSSPSVSPSPTLSASEPASTESGSATESGKASGAPVRAGTTTAVAPAGTPTTAAPSTSASSPSLPTALSACQRSDLGRTSTSSGQEDSRGRRVGWFTLYNTSGRVCTVTDSYSMRSVDGGGQQQVEIIYLHTAGDPATELPNPSTPSPSPVGPSTLKLDPQDGVRVEFEWVPTPSCQSAVGNPSGPTTPASTVTLEYFPPTGGAPLQLSYPSRCAGTVYRTNAMEEESNGTIETP